jgi:hypothetical protein
MIIYFFQNRNLFLSSLSEILEVENDFQARAGKVRFINGREGDKEKRGGQGEKLREEQAGNKKKPSLGGNERFRDHQLECRKFHHV